MGPSGLPPLDAVRAFEAVASAGSISAAAVSGAGLALVPDFLIADELAAGTLVEPFGTRLATGRGYRLRLAGAGRANP